MTQGKQQSHLSGILRAVIFGCLAAAALLLPLLAAAFHWHSSIQALVPFVEHYHGGDELEGAIFIGHLATDLDSIVAAIAAAELHRGTAAAASPIDSETAFALEHWGVPAPRNFEEVASTEKAAGRPLRICLVDHQSGSQIHPDVRDESVVGIIDHHALQAPPSMQLPIHIDIRPWGSTATILFHSFLKQRRRPTSRGVEGLLLSAIISDTLNLKSPTTTAWDRSLVRELVGLLGLESTEGLAKLQFKAKSSAVSSKTAHELVTGDMKGFSYAEAHFTGSVGIAVVETTDPASVIQRADELVAELAVVKKARGFDALLLAVVDIAEIKCTIVAAGPPEQSLVAAAFPASFPLDGSGGWLFDAGGKVSRKLDLVPGVGTAVKAGWSPAVKYQTGQTPEPSHFSETGTGEGAIPCTGEASPPDTSGGS